MLLHRIDDPHGFRVIEILRDGLYLVRREGAAPSELAEVSRQLCDSEAAAEEALAAAFEEERAAGAVRRLSPPEVARTFYENDFFPLLRDRFGAAPRSEPGSGLARAEDWFGVTFPEELRRLLAFADSHDTGRLTFGEWRWPGEFPVYPLKDESANKLAEYIALDRENYLGTAVQQIMTSLVPIGEAGNGDVYFAWVDIAHPEACEVYLWDHEERDLYPFADSIATLAYLNWMFLLDRGDMESDDDSDDSDDDSEEDPGSGDALTGDVLETLRAGVSAIASHADPSWHYESVIDNAGVEVSYETDSPVRFLYFRSFWVDALTSARSEQIGAANAGMAAKQRFFEVIETWHENHPFDSAKDGPRFLRSSTVAYWLFYVAFVEPDGDGLHDACQLLSRSNSGFVRDAAALFAQLDADWKAGKPGTLGPIEDAAALRRAFVEAESEKQRRLRLEAVEAARQEAFHADAAFAETLIAEAGDNDESLLAAVETHAERPGTVTRLFEHLGPRVPAVAAMLERVEVLADKERYREHEDARAWLDEHAPKSVAALLRARELEQIGANPDSSNLYFDTPRDNRGEELFEAPPLPSVTPETFAHLRSESARKALWDLCHPRRPFPETDEERAVYAEALAVFDAALALHRGDSVFMDYERLFREALAERAGRAVNLAAARTALSVAYANTYRTVQLHLVALDLLARHAEADEVCAAAMRFVAYDRVHVRDHARAILRDHGVADATRIVDAIEAQAMIERAGADELIEALADPWTRPLYPIIEAAVEHGLAEVIAPHAIEAFGRRYFGFVRGHGYYSSRWPQMLRAAKAIAELPGPAVDEFLHRMIHHCSPMLRAAISEVEHVERATSVGPPPKPESPQPLTLEPVAISPFMLGKPVHGIAAVDDLVVAAGAERSALFDASGQGHPLPPEVVYGWAYGVDLDPSRRRIALGYHAGHVVVLDLATRTVVRRLKHGGVPNGVRNLRFSPSGRALATCSCDRSLRVVDTETWEMRCHHKEPYDVNGVLWLDEETLLATTDRHVVVLPAFDSDPSPLRLDVGGATEPILVGRNIVVGTAKQGVVIIDPRELRIEHKIPLAKVARLRVSPDESTLWAVSWEGEDAGLWRIELATGERTCVIDGEAMFGLDVAEDGTVYAGGNAGVVHRVEASGKLIPRNPATHDAGIVAIKPAGPREVHTLDSTGKVLRFDAHHSEATQPWPSTPPQPRAEDFVALPDGGLAVCAFKYVSVLDPGGVERFRHECDRSEKVIRVGDTLILGSGRELVWLDPATGATLATVTAEVKSSWIEWLFALDGDDEFLVVGYDDPKLARYSSTARAPVHTVEHEMLHEDGRRHARPYAMTLSADRRRLYVSHWNEVVRILDTRTFKVEAVLDVEASYGCLAVDEQEQTLLAATGPYVHQYDIATGRCQGRDVMSAEVSSIHYVEPRTALVGLVNGELHRLT